MLMKFFMLFTLFIYVSLAVSPKCFPEFCKKQTELVWKPDNGYSCLLTPVERGEECVSMRFDKVSYFLPSNKVLPTFRLIAYVKNFEEYGVKTTAFNLSISNLNFHKLITRYQSLADERLSVCRHVQFHEKSTFPIPQFFISCPFSNSSYEGSAYRLEYLVAGSDFEYHRKLVFEVPKHRFIEENTMNAKTFTPFIYVDVSDTLVLTLYIQQLPKVFHITYYKVWLINNDTNVITSLHLVPADEEEHIQHNFTVHDGVNYFKVTAMHPDCGEYGCVNTTSPLISIKQASHRLLIMIISVIWIPPVLLYATYQAFKLYKKKGLLKGGDKKPNCLLVYSPTHAAHVDVMVELTRYLRTCNINAMLDVLDIPETPTKDPGLWCNTAFFNADIVLVITSPKTIKPNPIPIIYRNVDSHVLRLLKENYPLGNKVYYIVELPYCNSNDVPEEAKHFRRYRLPEELNKLVKTVLGIDFVRFFGVPNTALVDAIDIAQREIQTDVDDTDSPKISEESADDLLLPITQEVEILAEVPKGKTTNCVAVGDKNDISIPLTNYSTNINDLNLLGDSNTVEAEGSLLDSANIDCEFRIDKLNL